MADYDNRVLRGASAQAEAGQYDAGLRAYMLRVYNYMFIGLVITGLTAFGFFSGAFVSGPDGALAITSFGQAVYGSPLKWVLIIAPLVMVFYLSARINKMSFSGAQTSFWLYAFLTGASLGILFAAFTMISIAKVFFITAAMFGATSLYGYTTKKDLTGFGSFLMMGLFGIIIASVVNLFLHSAMMSWVISFVGVGLFAGLTAWDTQKIKSMYYMTSGADTATIGKSAIMGALALYLDFINMFIMLLQLLGDRR